MDKIWVDLTYLPWTYIAEADITPCDVAKLHARSSGSFVEAIAGLREGLAYVGITGKMELCFLSTGLDVEKELDEAFALPDEELTITPEYSHRIMKGEEPETADSETGKEGERHSDPTS